MTMGKFLTPADFLSVGLRLPPVSETAYDLGPSVRCTITGQPISRGYRAMDLTTDATGNFLDVFVGGVHGSVSEAAARCFRSTNPRTGNPCARSQAAFADPDTGAITLWQPLINREAAIEQGRPWWSSLVRTVWQERRGHACLLLLTTDTKKRLWPWCRVGVLGTRTPVYLYDSETCLNTIAFLDWPRLLDCLDLIEVVYSNGFSKPAIRAGLLTATKALAAVGFGRALAWERELTAWRSSPEWPMATLIAQRDEALIVPPLTPAATSATVAPRPVAPRPSRASHGPADVPSAPLDTPTQGRLF